MPCPLVVTRFDVSAWDSRAVTIEAYRPGRAARWFALIGKPFGAKPLGMALRASTRGVTVKRVGFYERVFTWIGPKNVLSASSTVSEHGISIEIVTAREVLRFLFAPNADDPVLTPDRAQAAVDRINGIVATWASDEEAMEDSRREGFASFVRGMSDWVDE